MTGKHFDIVAIGDCKADHFLRIDDYKILPARGKKNRKLVLDFATKIPVPEFKFFPGGNPLNAAVSFSRLGLKTAIYTVLGDDEEGCQIFQRMRQEKIATRFVAIDSKTATDKSIVLVTGGERTILGCHAEKRYRLPKAMPASWVYLTSLGRRCTNVYKTVAAARKRGAYRVAYNPGSRQLLYTLSAVKAMLKTCDLVFVNLEEAQRIAAKKTRNVKFLTRALCKQDTGYAVITDGPRGAFAFAVDGAKFFKIRAFPTKRVDATGAGDAFASAFTAALIHGFDVAEALRWGSLNAAGEIQQIGVQSGLMTLTQMKNALAAHKNFRAKEF